MKIIGQMVCGPGEADRYLKETLDDFARLCDDVVVSLCNATPKEEKLVRSYDFRSYYDNRIWGEKQPYIKTDLLRKIMQLDPDWIIVLDADETLPTIDRRIFEGLTEGRDSMYFYVVNLWNDPGHYAKSTSFWNVRAYRPKATTDHQFLKKALHCGNAPPYFYSLPARKTYVPHIMLHKGLMNKLDRERRVERYNQFDPQAIHKGREYYDMLASAGSGSIYKQDEVLAKLNEFYGSIKR